MKRLTYLTARPEKPLDLSTIHHGRPGSPYIVNGIRTKVGEHLLTAGGISSPFVSTPAALPYLTSHCEIVIDALAFQPHS